jgi:hypothetical protein
MTPQRVAHFAATHLWPPAHANCSTSRRQWSGKKPLLPAKRVLQTTVLGNCWWGRCSYNAWRGEEGLYLVACVVASKANAQENHLHTGTHNENVSHSWHEDSRFHRRKPHACDELLFHTSDCWHWLPATQVPQTFSCCVGRAKTILWGSPQNKWLGAVAQCRMHLAELYASSTASQAPHCIAWLMSLTMSKQKIRTKPNTAGMLMFVLAGSETGWHNRRSTSKLSII